MTGVTKFALRSSYDSAGTEPTWASGQGETYWNTYYADQTSTSLDPKLTVTYDVTAAAATAAFLLNFM